MDWLRWSGGWILPMWMDVEEGVEAGSWLNYDVVESVMYLL